MTVCDTWQWSVTEITLSVFNHVLYSILLKWKVYFSAKWYYTCSDYIYHWWISIFLLLVVYYNHDNNNFRFIDHIKEHVKGDYCSLEGSKVINKKMFLLGQVMLLIVCYIFQQCHRELTHYKSVKETPKMYKQIGYCKN